MLSRRPRMTPNKSRNPTRAPRKRLDVFAAATSAPADLAAEGLRRSAAILATAAVTSMPASGIIATKRPKVASSSPREQSFHTHTETLAPSRYDLARQLCPYTILYS
ncbi:hypothetical protein BC939DRAFT_529197 [Gamsiella multidivaricata]|uniref:uncharacterized protein n=1 Tax=Gamsiella multidivaricata TaxID=101098 RepID=UPI00221EA78C|nr:uncharacterized protein BC939DRAFT_529197 [Gamsiella multidivaricata]KAI7823002.1 hypothetical protein BC939DRAFT_529197 [Gamsiella multidivaricata]